MSKIKPLPFIWGLRKNCLTQDKMGLSEDAIKVFTSYPPTGFILFKDVINSQSQLQILTGKLKNSFDYPIKICIDEEGGRVSRMISSKLITASSFPAAESYYVSYQKSVADLEKNQHIDLAALKKVLWNNTCAQVYKNYKRIGDLLKELGINTVFAPVCDLRSADGHDVIGDRSFGWDIETVVLLCLEAFKGLRASGITGCMKHVPGHGRAKCDSHNDLPKINATLEELENSDFMVFKRLAEKLKAQGSDAMVMTAHLLYECLDADNPVTLSSKGIKYIRSNLVDDMLITTDCMNMNALYNFNFSQENLLSQMIKNSIKAYDAGCNFILFSKADLNQIRVISEAFIYNQKISSSSLYEAK